MWRALFGFAIMFIVLGGLSTAMVRSWVPHRWSDPRFRRPVIAIPLVGLSALALWTLSKLVLGSAWLADLMSATASLMLMFELALVLSLPVYALIGRFARPAEPTSSDSPQSHPNEEPVTLTRRALLTTAAAAPVALGGLAMGGLATSRLTANIEEKPFYYDALPAPLEGLRILHLSDIHIGFSFSLRDLEAVLDAASAQHPDIVLVTGDLSDRIPELPDALSLIADLKPRYGAYASVGNHEYWRGITDVRRAHDRSEVPMLLDAGHTLPIVNEAGSAKLFIAGADDPVRMRGDLSSFLTNTVTQALEGRPEDAFTVLMSHRPRGFDAAAQAGVELTLSGHTHGGQMGWGGRSLFEPFLEEMYLWGHYRNGVSQLYTSSGVGHWFPFRVGCPTEAPLIMLRKR